MNTQVFKEYLKLKLGDCPEGAIFEEKEPNAEVNKFFDGWHNPLANHDRPSLLYVKHEKGGSCIKHPVVQENKPFHRYDLDRYLVGGSYCHRDYTVRAELTLDSYLSSQSADNSTFVRAMAGIFGRFQDGRHYYYFCIDGIGDASCALYKREDDTWTELGRAPVQINAGSYYQLALGCYGANLVCSLNGKELFTAIDYTFGSGCFGFRFSTAGRVRNFEVMMTPGQRSYNEREEHKYNDSLESVRACYPRMILLKKIDCREYAPFSYQTVTLPDGGKGFLIQGKTRTALLDMDGKRLWERNFAGYYPVVTEPYRGSFDIVGAVDTKLTSIDGATGNIRRQAEFTDEFDHNINPGYNYSGWPPAAVNLRGTPVARDIILKENNCPAGSGTLLWAYDEDLNPLWTIHDVYPLYGHLYSFAFWDMDGKGREDVFAGCSRYSPDGELIWQAEDHYEMANIHDALHIDSNIIGNFSGDPELDPVLFCSSGSAGVYAVNARNGKTIANHRVGHAQAIYAGRFLPDAEGLCVMSVTRWNNYGIITVYDGRGNRLRSFHPDYITEGGPIVNWLGNGTELLTICSGTKEMGLYDGYGRRVVDFPPEVHNTYKTPEARHTNKIKAMDMRGTGRDELIFDLDGVLHVYTQDAPVPSGRIYTPQRRLMASYPQWQGAR
ncbi:MAG: hypothetical protein FWC45_09135 [Treponema sp.]|nr:hypothetical protein [Treponema sp.]